MTGSTTSRKTRVLFGLAGSATLIIGWQILSMVVNRAIVASPWESLMELGRLVSSGAMLRELLITLRRLVIALAVGTTAGLTLGMVAGLRPRIRSFLEPIRWVAMTLPAVVIAVLAMLWFGLGDKAVVFLVAAIVTPVIYVNTVEGVLSMDARILEMGRVYRVPRRLLLTEVYLPGIGSPVVAGLTLATGIGVRGVVLGEVLGAQDGIGHAFARAMSYLDTPRIFAWVLVALGLMA
ncbi:MAG: ABC transporter permease subunit, partial [Actinobacteria bacterium]|nr:ABC transporter permease subunit [Actinomycetota bacterium]